MRKFFAITVVLGGIAASATPALATPVATDDATYAQYGRVFPDPLAGCVATPCSPNAQGNQPATQFIQYPEMIDGLTYLNSKPQWRRYLEVLPLDGKLGDGNGTNELQAFPGNDLGRFEFDPKKNYHSAGLPQTGDSRKVSDLIMARITDETVPDKGKKRYAVSLSIHGIERAGAEGGTRQIEDMVTAVSTGKLDKRVLPAGSTTNIPTFREVLRRAIVYIFYPNPDGWRRGDVSEGGVFFQRYNGNGMDVNRDWPDVGFSFRPYSPLSEPESRGFAGVLRQIGRRTNGFNQGADLHGQLEADALSFTLMPHGVHNYGKNLRIQRVAQTIHGASEKALAWSPIIQPNDAPRGGGAPCAPTVVGGDACAKIYGQTFGTVYDTINYTTTGAMGDWFDSPKGLDANGIDNEMSFSHLDKNINFDPHTEQLHVDGNKALINAQITRMLDPPKGKFKVAGAKGYVPNQRLKRKFQQLQSTPPTGTKPQPDIEATGFANPAEGGQTIFPIDVKRSKTIFDGGMRVEITNLNAQGIGSGSVTLTIQCRACDANRHPGQKNGDWVTVTQDFNQSPIYLQAGVVATVNEPQATNGKGKKVEWRAVVGQGGLSSRMVAHFTSGPAAVGGETGSPKAQPPRLLAYNVADTDFYRALNRFIPSRSKRFHAVSPRRVAAGRQSLANFDSLAVSDDAFPGTSTAAQRARWYAALRGWVKRGGNLVLTDGALQALPLLTSIPASAVKRIKVYVGQIAFSKDGNGDTLGDPLNKGVKIAGARFNSGMRRQMFEPVPLGYRITDEAGNDETHSPQWQVSRDAWEKAGGRTAATGVEDGSVGGTNDYDQTAYGQLKLGKGVIRILGAALPQPTTQYDHDFGLSPHSATYTTYILMHNLLKPITTSCHDFKRPRAFIDRGSVHATRQGISMRGTATDKGCLAGGKGKIARMRVAIATRKNTGGKNRCRFAKPDGGLTRPRGCKHRLFMAANGRENWTFDYNHPLPNGRYTIRARPIDSVGNLALRTRRSTLHLTIR